MEHAPLNVHVQDGIAAPAHVGAGVLKHVKVLLGKHAGHKAAVEFDLYASLDGGSNKAGDLDADGIDGFPCLSFVSVIIS